MADNQGPVAPSPIDWEILGPGAQGIASIIALLRLLSTPPDDPDHPTKPFVHPQEAGRQAFQGLYWTFKDMGWGGPLSYLFAALGAFIVIIGGMLGQTLLWLLKNVGAEFALDVLQIVDAARKEIDPTVATMSVSILNEMLGTEFTAAHLATGEDVAAHLERASEIGGMFHKQLRGEFQTEGDVTPDAGRGAAERFTGFLVNFGTATALLSIAGDLASFGKFEQFRELGVEVARNLGLGRLHRQVMRPVINTLIAQPYQWWLNQRFHPTQFKEGDLVSPFQQNLMPHDDIFKAMDLLGYSSDKIEALIKLHEKKISVSDVALFSRYGTLSAQDATVMLKDLGYPEEMADLVLKADDLRRADAAVRTLITEMETRVINGELATEDFSIMLDGLPIGPIEKRFILDVAQVKVKAPHAHLTTAQAQKAFEEGVWTLDQLDGYFAERGYSADDTQTMELLTLLTLAKLDEAKKVALFAYDKKVAAAKAKNEPIPPPPAILSS